MFTKEDFFDRIKEVNFANYFYVSLIPSFSLVMVKFYFFYLPFLVFYTNRLIPERASGYVFFLFIFVKPIINSKDLSVITHEVTHLRQVFRTGGLHYPLYNFNQKYRYKSELEAYSYQCLHLIVSHKGELSLLLINDLISKVVDIFVTDFNFISDTKKDKDVVTDDFMKVMIVLLKNYKDEL